jgi:hypothetical protein
MPTRDALTDGGSFLGRVGALVLHTLFVYFCALRISPLLISRWFAWIAPVLQISISVPSGDWYLQHLELATIFPAFIAGCFNVLRVVVASFRIALAWMDEPPDLGQYVSVAMWAWTIPTLILCYKMLTHRASNSSVLDDRSIYEAVMPTIRYFFVIEQEGPRLVGNSISGDPARVLAQMLVTAPFYAGIAYSLGALSSKYSLFAELRHEVFRVSEDSEPKTSESDQ